MDRIVDGFDQAPPFQVQHPPMHGYRYYQAPMQAPYTMAQIHPPQEGMGGFYQTGWPPQTAFAPPMQPWLPYHQLRQGRSPGMEQLQAHAAGDVGVHRISELDARAILADALKKGEQLELSPREVLAHLQSREKYRGINWTALFLDSAVLPGSNSDTARDASQCAATSGSQGSQATTSAAEPAQKKRRTTHTTGRPRGRPRTRKVPAGSRDDRPVASSLSTASSSTSSASGAWPWGTRPKRGGKLDEFHHETYIPPSDNSLKPIVPCRDSGDDLSKFSAEEKIFFIHWLRWRLREGRLPSKVTLLAELAKELPHHDAEAWKKHWNKDAMLPDDIYSTARKRVVSQGLSSSSDLSDSSTLTPAPTTDDEYRPSSPRQSKSPPLVVSAAPSAVNQKVTEDDLRAMALYMVEKREEWMQQKTPSRSQRWEEFSRRQENYKRRSHGGWCNVERHYTHELQQMYKEYLAQKRDAETEDERDESETRNLVYPADSERGEEPRADLETPTAEPPAVAPSGSCNSARANPTEGFATVKIKREYIEVSDSD